MKRLAAAMILAGLIALAVSPGRSAPKPSEVPASWQLEIHLETPKAFEVTLRGQAIRQRFWFLLFTITNRTGDDRIFVPEFVLYTDTGQIIRSEQGVSKAVFRAIKKEYNDPLLTDMDGLTGKLLQGEDNAKSGVAIWRDFDAQAGAFDLLLGGLSGETAEIQLPKPIEVVETDTDGKETVVLKSKAILSKTYQLSYSVPGEAAARLRVRVKLKKKQWVMR